MLWMKSLHIVFVIAWFAGIFYLPRLFVYHAMTDDVPGRERLRDAQNHATTRNERYKPTRHPLGA